MQQSSSFLIIGSGIAGMSTAIHLSHLGRVILLTKTQLISGSTPLAQGGIAGVLHQEDSFEKHIQDTMNAGGNTNTLHAVTLLVHNAPEEIQFLENIGVQFEKTQHLEGGHSFPRVSNIKDISGKVIATTLAEKVRSHPNITLIENADVFSFNAIKKQITYTNTLSFSPHTLSADFIIFATGGYSSLYQNSTSPQENMGDGISLCINAGIETKDLHSVQFHPTVLNKKRKNKPQLLLTEAIRGFGAKIVDKNGQEIIDALLPRDIVSKAIYDEELRNITSSEKNPVFLDARNITNFAEHFPFIAEVLLHEFHINPQTQLIPITFGAHYCMGGITTNIWGETNIPTIYAVGECANTGVHGNNRLASNSLLEGLVFARQIAKNIREKMKNINPSESVLSIENKNYTLSPKEEKKEEEEIVKVKEKEERRIEQYTEYNTEFLETIKNTLSQYLSIEGNKKIKIKNIQTAENIFKNLERNKSILSHTNKNILILVQKLAKDAKNNV